MYHVMQNIALQSISTNYSNKSLKTLNEITPDFQIYTDKTNLPEALLYSKKQGE